MRRTLILAALLLTPALTAYAQGGSTPYPRATPDPLNPETGASKSVRRSEDLNRRSDALRMTRSLPPSVPSKKRQEFLEKIRPIYRESTDEERAFLAPAKEDAENYKRLANGRNSGLIRLLMDRGCAGRATVVNAAKECEGLTMPGGGSAYSFRTGDYRIARIADIVFNKGRFEALGVLNHGIMVDLGNIPIESVTKGTEGVRYLTKIKPSKDFAQAADLANKLTKGMKKDGRTYASILPVRDNSTYVLRSIAYEGESLQRAGGFVFNELELDKRRDVLIAFKVVRDFNGNDVTIAWKQLDDSRAPELRQKK